MPPGKGLQAVLPDVFGVLAVLGLRCCAGFSPVVVGGGQSLVAERGLLVAASSVAEHGLLGTV